MPFNPLDPFVPSWYHDAFDSYDSVSDVQANTNTVIGEGYSVPDADGSRCRFLHCTKQPIQPLKWTRNG